MSLVEAKLYLSHETDLPTVLSFSSTKILTGRQLKMPQKVLISGATGLLGRQVTTAFKQSNWTTISTGFSRLAGDIQKLDINHESAVQQILDKERYAANRVCSTLLMHTQT